MSPTRRAAVVTGLALAATAASGCATRGSGGQQAASGETRPAAAPCNGQAYVEVNNRFETSVDVYAYGKVSGDRRYLGTVAPGTQRLSAFPDMGYVYAEVGGQRVTGKAANQGQAGGISFTRGCDSGG